MRTDDVRRQAAGLFMVGFPGTTPTLDVLSLIDDGIAGCILFKRNVESAGQVAQLNHALKAHAARPFLLAVDQEGGRVARLRGAPFTAVPTMRALGDLGDEALAERVGRLLAFEVRAAGFDWDFAPVLDVDTNPANPVIGDRSFSRDEQVVTRLGLALARGMEAQGVASCAKHFPGHGDTAQDSHLALPHLPHDLTRLRRVELAPFAAWARAGLSSIMTAHVIFDALSPGVPATMSRAVLQGLLRDELHFEGVVVSDDLEMKAIADHFPVERAVVEGLLAGVDLFLVCHDPKVQRRAIDAVVTAIKDGRVPLARIEAALTRISFLAGRFAQVAEDGLSALGSAEHHALSRGLATLDVAGRDPTEGHAKRS